MNTLKNIGSRRELFIDDWLIDRMDGVQLKMHSPQPREIVLDGEQFGYVTVFKDADRFRLYYCCGAPYDVTGFKDKETYLAFCKAAPQRTAYAESRDGIVWERPELGLCAVAGSKANNIVWDSEGVGDDASHNFTPFLDLNPAVDPGMRYKAVAGLPGGGGLKAFVSADGVRWRKLRDEPVITEGYLDSQNLAFWDPLRGQYVAFIRDFIGRHPVRKGGYSVNAGYNGGEFITKPLIFEGDRLRLNYATSAVGSVRVEIQDATGRPIEGYGLNDECYGDAIDGEIHWEAGADLGKLAGQPVRLRFVLQDADVYAFQFGCRERQPQTP